MSRRSAASRRAARLKQSGALNAPIAKVATWTEALPQLIKLFKLIWQLAPARGILMGNFTKSALPAYDLSLRARLIEMLNAIISRRQQFDGRQIGQLLGLQLVSLALRNVLQAAVARNQEVVNRRVSAVLTRQLLRVHLSLDVAALNDEKTMQILGDARGIANQQYLNAVMTAAFSSFNATVEITSRVLAASQTLSWASMPYFLLYSTVPLINMLKGHMQPHWRDREMQPPAEAEIRKRELSKIIFSPKYRREVNLFGLQDWLLSEYVNMDELASMAAIRSQHTDTVLTRAANVFTSWLDTAILAYLAHQSGSSDISLADLHIIENTTSSFIRTSQHAYKSLDQASLVWEQLINYDKSLELKPLLPLDGDVVQYKSSGRGMYVEFRDVVFGYPDQAPILDGVSFKIEAGEMACIVGFNGAGKSTIIQLLARVLDPISGAILLDEVDLRQYDPVSLRAHVAFTFQDFLRYPLTGRENVAIGKIDRLSDEERIQAAASATGADKVLDAKASSEGDVTLWDSKLSQREPIVQGVNANGPTFMQPDRHDLSGGQWQKVALSRSFMHDSTLLVLDEPSANLDPQAEYDLFLKLQQSRAHRTTLFVTHRLGVVRSADKIILIESGQVLEVGSHTELVGKEGGRYRHLFELQSSGFEQMRQVT